MQIESSSFGENIEHGIIPDNAAATQLISNRSATANVYKIRIQNKWLVLKRIKPEFIDNSLVVSCFDKEFELGFNIDHPNAVKYINKGKDKDGVYLITEYIEGNTLRDSILKNPNGIADKQLISKWLTQLIDLIKYLHERDVFHLDIKPENILITAKGENSKLIDFGFSHNDSFLSVSGGTKKYNLHTSTNESISSKNDFYALGVVALELLTGSADLKQIKQLPKNYADFINACISQNAHINTDYLIELLSAKKNKVKKNLIIASIVVFLVAIASVFYFENNKELISIKNNAWQAQTTLPQGRADGGVVYKSGLIYYVSGIGADDGLTTNNVFAYNIKTQQSKELKPIPTARAELATVLFNDKIYTFGGWLGNGCSNAAEVYDITTNTWDSLPHLPKKITGMSATVLNNKIYILGSTLGVTNTFFFEFNPLEKTYKPLAVFRASRMNVCLASVENKIYAIGGNSYKNDNYFLYNDCDIYDVTTNSWEQKSSLPIVVTRGSIAVKGNEIHYLGGVERANSVTDADALNAHWVYNTKTDIWRNEESLPIKVFGNETVLANGKIYCVGGYEKLPNASAKVFKQE